MYALRQKIKNFLFIRKFKKNKETVFIDNLLKQDIEALRLIASTGYNFNTRVADIMAVKDMFPLHICAQYQLRQSLEFLLAHGVSIRALDINHRNFLMFAVIFSRGQNFDFLDYVIQKDHDFSHRDYDGNNVLCYFYRCDEPLRLLKLLISRGSDVRQVLGEGRNFFDFFLYWYDKRMRESLRERMLEVGLYLVDLMTPQEAEKYLRINCEEIRQKAQTALERDELQRSLPPVIGESKSKFKL